ncbi:MAG: glycosyltransferase family 4 protein [Candidatus Buchananbacteria bacterium]|nr:glycosyltransferase family 4 protein [Candidatus Buchananbacteria bacterium]
MKHILIAAEIFPPDIGGPATYTVKIAEALQQKGFDVDVVCYSDNSQTDDFSFAVHRILRSRFKLLHYFNYYRALKKLAKNTDVIYAMGPVSSGRPALKVAKELKKKLVVKVVGDYAWERARNLNETQLSIDEFQTKFFNGKIGMLQKTERQVCRQADAVITPSEYLKKIVEGWGVEGSKIKVVYNSFDATILNQTKKIDGKKIVSAARLVPWKGFEALIDLMGELPKDFKLEIFGDGPDQKKLKQKIINSKLEDRVLLAGQVSRDQLFQALAGKIFVLNTGYEGLSHTILEAFAVGIPVIATAVGGNPELISDNVNGLLVEYNNKDQIKEAILKLSGDEILQNKFVENAKKVLEKFSAQKMINDTVTVLNSL